MAESDRLDEKERNGGLIERTSDDDDTSAAATGLSQHDRRDSAAPMLNRAASGPTPGGREAELKETASHARPSSDDIELEETETPHYKRLEADEVVAAGDEREGQRMTRLSFKKQAVGGGGVDGHGAREEGTAPNVIARGSGEDVVPEGGYRTYKRRWFGLVQLTLLNIIVSWDVSTQFSFGSPGSMQSLCFACTCSAWGFPLS
jgi:hypothetical protein